MEQIEKIRNQVQAYFNQNAQNYIPNFVYLGEDDKNHIVNIGTSIICTRHNVGYPGGSFVQSIVNNDLRGTFATADDININAIRFYLMMIHNMGVTL
jgi:hypothetical protein